MKADIVIKSDVIFDSTRNQPFAGFVAVKGNKICAVGKNMEESKG